ncbi:MAG: DNA-processing protein DprA [Coriobacteriales bacterium]|jgi:DNA processing protein|nr:DNA-processing protein DprA [Coriobacteriales bacterium]
MSFYLDVGKRYKRKEIVPSDTCFPKLLQNIERPVQRLYAIGNVSLLEKPSLAIVGARKATPYGLGCAQHFARLASRHGITIVSGGAIGCDQAAHKGAISANGRTIVVLGNGADVVYPRGANELFEQVLHSDGVLVSEAPWGAKPNKYGFVRRNRIIAGLALATLIVEAGLPSGTFTTADASLAQGKDVMVVPGAITSSESQGANNLLLLGALPVVDDQSFLNYLCDIFHECMSKTFVSQGKLTNEMYSKSASYANASSVQRSLLDAICAKASTPEELVHLLAGNMTQTIRELSTLELAGDIIRMRDGRYGMQMQNS